MPRIPTTWFIAFVVAASGLVATAEGQSPPLVPTSPRYARGHFQFIAGAWAAYDAIDMRSNRTWRVWCAITDRTEERGKPAAWIEIDVATPGQPRVLTRMLVEETTAGPGRIYRVIQQVEGQSPVRVSPSGDRIPALVPLTLASGGKPVSFPWKGQLLATVHTQASDPTGGVARVAVCEQIPPLGIVSVDTPNVRIAVDSWGLNATSRLQGNLRRTCLGFTVPGSVAVDKKP